MAKPQSELKLGLSEYALTAYVALTSNHPVNGSQLSRQSGIPRARIYDVLETLMARGFVMESAKGMYTPIPPDEFLRQLRQEFDGVLDDLEKRINKAKQPPNQDVIWTMKGYDTAMGKAKEMISRATDEIYIRVAPEEGQLLDDDLMAAQDRGVAVKYISMGEVPISFRYQIIHPECDPAYPEPGTRFFDLVTDKSEILCGMFVEGDEDASVINWGLNIRFVLSGRDSLRHDFFHYFLHRLKDLDQALTPEEEALYAFIRADI